MTASSSWRFTRGFTLLELVITIAVLALLITITAPSISETIRNNQIAAQNNELIALINLARNEAVRRNIAEGGVQVILTNTSGGWDGLVVIPSGAADEDLDCDVDGAIRCSSLSDATLSRDEVTLEFNNRGYLNPFQPVNFSLTHKKCSTRRQARAISITGVGQVESAPTNC